MEANSQGISEEQFRVNHLRNRIAQITVEHEDAVANFAVLEQVLRQELEKAQGERQALADMVVNLQAQLAEFSPEQDLESEDDDPVIVEDFSEESAE